MIQSNNVRTELNWNDPFTMGVLEHVETRCISGGSWRKARSNSHNTPFGNLNFLWSIVVDSESEKPFRIYHNDEGNVYTYYTITDCVIQLCAKKSDEISNKINLPKLDVSFKMPETVGEFLLCVERAYLHYTDLFCELVGLSTDNFVSMVYHDCYD